MRFSLHGLKWRCGKPNLQDKTRFLVRPGHLKERDRRPAHLKRAGPRSRSSQKSCSPIPLISKERNHKASSLKRDGAVTHLFDTLQLRVDVRTVPALYFRCKAYHSTQNESLYSENKNLFWKTLSKISQTKKKL